MSFRTQIFTAILAICITSVLGMQLFVRFSVQEEFRSYLMARESKQVAPLINELTRYYLKHRNWEQIKESENIWLDMKADFILSNELVLAEKAVFRYPKNTPPNLNLSDYQRNLSKNKPLFLLDQNQQLVTGKEHYTDRVLLLSIDVDNSAVGYIGVPFRPELMDDYPGQNFMSGLDDHLLIITLVALLLAAITAIPISYLLVRRIQSLVYVLKQYSLGKFDEPVHTTGKDELSELAVHLSNLGYSLKKVEQTRKQWVADISHELRTPLAVLQADLEALEDGVRELNIDSIKRLHGHSNRLSNLVDDLYTLSLSDTGALTYCKTDCDLLTIVEQSIEVMKPEFVKAGLELSFNVAMPKQALILGDPKRLTQMIHNLLRNSLRYTHAPGQVKVSFRTLNNQAEIEISDSAPGVPAALHDKLFERLFRVDVSRNRHHGGAGLGLSLCKNIVTAHQGDIRIQDSPFGGLTVIVHLPLKTGK